MQRNSIIPNEFETEFFYRPRGAGERKRTRRKLRKTKKGRGKKERREGEEMARGRRSRGVGGEEGRKVARLDESRLETRWLLRPSIDSTLATCWLPTVLDNFYGKLLQMGKSTLVLRATSLFFHVSRRALS